MDSLKYEGYVLVDGTKRIKLKCRLYEQKVKSNSTRTCEDKLKMINDIIDGKTDGNDDNDINNILNIMNDMIMNARYTPMKPTFAQN